MFNIKQYYVVSLYSFCCRLATAGKYVGIPMTITVCQKYFIHWKIKLPQFMYKQKEHIA